MASYVSKFVRDIVRKAGGTSRRGASGRDPVTGIGINTGGRPVLGEEEEGPTTPEWSGGVQPIFTHQVPATVGPGGRTASPRGQAGGTNAGGDWARRSDSLWGGAFEYDTGGSHGYETQKIWEAAMVMDPEGRARMIQWMVDVGLLDPKELQSRTGISQAVFQALDYIGGVANGDGITMGQAMKSISSQAQSNGKGQFQAAAQVPPLVMQLRDPEYLRKNFKQTSFQMLGQHLPDDVIQRQVDAFQEADRAYQTEVHMATYQDPETSSTDVGAAPNVTEIAQPPAPDEFIENAVWDIDPDGVEARGYLDTAMQFFDSLSGPANQTRKYG